MKGWLTSAQQTHRGWLWGLTHQRASIFENVDLLSTAPVAMRRYCNAWSQINLFFYLNNELEPGSPPMFPTCRRTLLALSQSSTLKTFKTLLVEADPSSLTRSNATELSEQNQSVYESFKEKVTCLTAPTGTATSSSSRCGCNPTRTRRFHVLVVDRTGRRGGKNAVTSLMTSLTDGRFPIRTGQGDVKSLAAGEFTAWHPGGHGQGQRTSLEDDSGIIRY